MREGGRLYCRFHRQTCKVCIDQRLAATEATCTGPCSALLPPNYKTHQKEGRETTLPLVVLAGNRTPEKERDGIKRFWRKEGVEERGWGDLQWHEKRKEDWTSEQVIQKSLKEDLWFGKGVASASTESDLASTVQYSTVQFIRWWMK